MSVYEVQTMLIKWPVCSCERCRQLAAFVDYRRGLGWFAFCRGRHGKAAARLADDRQIIGATIAPEFAIQLLERSARSRARGRRRRRVRV